MSIQKTIYYARVSTKDQNLARQLEAFKNLGARDEEIVTDKSTGKNFEREGYQALKGQLGLRSGDTLIVKELDRLGRNKQKIKEELEYWKNKGVRVKVIDIPTTMVDIVEQEWVVDMINNILIEVLSSIAEQEREKILTRQKEGIEAMPIINGKKVSLKTNRATGRPSQDFPENWEEEYINWKNKKITAVQAMKRLEIKKTSFYKLVKIYENTEQKSGELSE